MADLKAWWRARRPTTRRLTQLYCALLFNAHLKGFGEGKLYTGPAKLLCTPGLNCYSCPGAVGACPLGALQNALGASGHTAGWYALGILLLWGVTLGRTVCGWLCPFGLIQELLHRLPTPKLRKGRLTRALSWLKYAVLAVLVLAIPLAAGLSAGLTLPAFCKYLCPAGTLEGALGLLPANPSLMARLGVFFTNKLVILSVILLLCVFCHRAFCRFLCPLGAIYGLFSRVALTGVRVDESRCNGCGACVRACGMDICRVGDRECISCGACVSACPRSAISLRCGRVTLLGPGAKPAQKKRRALQALALLAFALLWFNLLDPALSAPDAGAVDAVDVVDTVDTVESVDSVDAVDPADSADPGPAAAEAGRSDAPIGHEVGQRLPDFTCELMDGTLFRLSDCLGHTVVINQWATYCGPCVAELPLFERLQEERPDIIVLAFHHSLQASPTPADFIESQGWSDWSLRFAVDPSDEPILRATGGDNTMPRTVVLNEKGEVLYNEPRTVSYEMLMALVE